MEKKQVFPETDAPMITQNSAELREWAVRCEDAAAFTTDENLRISLLRKCEALRALADSEDWLAGQSADSGKVQNGPVFPSSDQPQAAE